MYVAVAAAGAVVVAVVAVVVAIRGPARGADSARRGATMALAARLLADPACTELPATLPERCTPMIC